MHDDYRVGVFGLGSMGLGMARSILRAGHRTHGFDVISAQEEKFRAEGGAAGTVADVGGEMTSKPCLLPEYQP